MPPDFPEVIPPPKLLDPREATPDLPLRVGFEQKDKEHYAQLVRDQGQHPTCVAHAVTTGLSLALLRVGKIRSLKNGGFSAAWVHHQSATVRNQWNAGRTIKSGIDAVRDILPCEEKAFPYEVGHLAEDNWKTPEREKDAENITKKLGLPMIIKLKTSEISRMKMLLAGGWVVILGAAFPEFWKGGVMTELGIPLLPLGGPRANLGHAWVIVGYDHVDGNQQWKYQGRFWCLNSWGEKFPRKASWGAGLCSIPFSCLLTLGIEAYAIRFPKN